MESNASVPKPCAKVDQTLRHAHAERISRPRFSNVQRAMVRNIVGFRCYEHGAKNASLHAFPVLSFLQLPVRDTEYEHNRNSVMRSLHYEGAVL